MKDEKKRSNKLLEAIRKAPEDLSWLEKAPPLEGAFALVAYSSLILAYVMELLVQAMETDLRWMLKEPKQDKPNLA